MKEIKRNSDFKPNPRKECQPITPTLLNKIHVFAVPSMILINLKTDHPRKGVTVVLGRMNKSPLCPISMLLSNYNRQIKIGQISYLHMYVYMAIVYRTTKFTCKSANILAIAILGSTAKFNPCQYFRL